MLTVGDLFSGIGGFSLGLERAGMRTRWFSEIDPYASAVLRKHWADVPNHGDIRNVGRGTVEPVDVLCGGFPCQDISNAGKRAGIDGERSGLWAEYARVIGELRPRYVVVENVSALLSGRDKYELPIDRCVCGWPYRRRGLSLGACEQGSLVQPEMRHRNVGQGLAGAANDEGEIRWGALSAARGNGEVGGCVALDAGGRQVTNVVDGSCAAPCPEGGAGAITNGAVHDQRAGDEGSCFGVEQEGADDAGECPCCGRPVADQSTRPFVGTWFGRVLGDLAALGFDAEWHCIPASAVGAPHRRDRIWIVADSRQQRECSAHNDGCCVERGGPQGREQLVGDSGGGANVAYADEPRLERWLRASLRECSDEWALGTGGTYVAHANGAGLSASRKERGESYRAGPTITASSLRREWLSEPDVGRVANGVPSRVDRLRCLGNAIVPQIAEIIGRAILKANQ